MADSNIWEALTDIKNQRRKAYFMWKNNIQNIKMNYGELTEEEFIEVCDSRTNKPVSNPEVFFNYLKRWESSAEYKRLLFLLKEDSFASDLLDVYESTKKLAVEGESQAIKNMLLLQKEIKKYRQSIDSFQEKEELELEEEEADDLII